MHVPASHKGDATPVAVRSTAHRAITVETCWGAVLPPTDGLLRLGDGRAVTAAATTVWLSTEPAAVAGRDPGHLHPLGCALPILLDGQRARQWR